MAFEAVPTREASSTVVEPLLTAGSKAVVVDAFAQLAPSGAYLRLRAFVGKAAAEAVTDSNQLSSSQWGALAFSQIQSQAQPGSTKTQVSHHWRGYGEKQKEWDGRMRGTRPQR